MLSYWFHAAFFVVQCLSVFTTANQCERELADLRLKLSAYESKQAWLLQIQSDRSSFSGAHQPTGTSIAFRCKVQGLPIGSRPGIVWTKRNGDIASTGNVELIREDEFTVLLRINNSQVEDTGVYECATSFGGASKSEIVDVFVFDELRFVDNASEISPPREGASFNLSCRVHATSSSGLITMWEKGLAALTNTSERGYLFHENNQVIEIRNYRHEDDGTYECKVFDRRTGAMLSKEIKVGTAALNKQFCTRLCTNLCGTLYEYGRTSSNATVAH